MSEEEFEDQIAEERCIHCFLEENIVALHDAYLERFPKLSTSFFLFDMFYVLGRLGYRASARPTKLEDIINGSIKHAKQDELELV